MILAGLEGRSGGGEMDRCDRQVGDSWLAGSARPTCIIGAASACRGAAAFVRGADGRARRATRMARLCYTRDTPLFDETSDIGETRSALRCSGLATRCQ